MTGTDEHDAVLRDHLHFGRSGRQPAVERITETERHGVQRPCRDRRGVERLGEVEKDALAEFEGDGFVRRIRLGVHLLHALLDGRERVACPLPDGIERAIAGSVIGGGPHQVRIEAAIARGLAGGHELHVGVDRRTVRRENFERAGAGHLG
ncbi:hypothetical protein GCM10008965_16850 [Methylorubrum aminovorans]